MAFPSPKYPPPEVENFGVVNQYSTDSVEFCPHEGYTNYFVCGTYQLIEDEKVKVGRLHLNKLNSRYIFCIPNILQFISNNIEVFTEVVTKEVPAILDLKWSYQKINDKIILGEANADGSLSLFSFSDDDSFAMLSTYSIDSDSLCLSLDWNNRLSNK
jgi:diphthamide biosynthesis protein 7